MARARKLTSSEEQLASDLYNLTVKRFKQVGNDMIDRMTEADLDPSTTLAVINAALSEVLGESMGIGLPKSLYPDVIKRVRQVASHYARAEGMD